MNCWDRFDMKAAVIFSKKPQNAEMLERETMRVGFSFVPFWGCQNPYGLVIEANVRHTRMCKGGWMDCTLNHNRIVRTAYELGKRSVLILEDDARFLKDKTLLGRIVEALPDDYDIAMLDWVVRGKATDEECDALLKAPLVNGYWKRFTDLRSTACWALSRKGMEAWLYFQEAAARGEGKMCLSDQYFYYMNRRDPSLKMYCSFPCCAEQADLGGITSAEGQQRRYARMGMLRECYREAAI